MDNARFQKWIEQINKDPCLVLENMLDRRLKWHEKIIFKIQCKLYKTKLHRNLTGWHDILWVLSKAWDKIR